jgi:hypothetical protein
MRINGNKKVMWPARIMTRAEFKTYCEQHNLKVCVASAGPSKGRSPLGPSI